MRPADTRIEVRRLLGLVLGRPIAAQEMPSRATEPNWDSLKHIELMFLLEDHFGIRFSPQQMEAMEDIESIAHAVEALHAA